MAKFKQINKQKKRFFHLPNLGVVALSIWTPTEPPYRIGIEIDNQIKYWRYPQVSYLAKPRPRRRKRSNKATHEHTSSTAPLDALVIET